MFNLKFSTKYSLSILFVSFAIFFVSNTYAQHILVGTNTKCGAGLTFKKQVKGKNYYSGGRNTEVFWTGTTWVYKEGGVIYATNSANTKSKAPCSANFPWKLTAAGKKTCLGKKSTLDVKTNCSAVIESPKPMTCKGSSSGAKLVFVSQKGNIINLKMYWDEGSTFVGSNNLSITNGVCEDCPRIGGIGRPHGTVKAYKIKRTNASKPVIIKWTGSYCGTQQMVIN